jgi:serine/threonine protein kinase
MLVGQQLGHYRLVHLIGQGGMGEVYLAEDTRISRQVAVKIVRNERQPYSDAQALRQAKRLFQREMEAVAQLDHPHILSLHDFGEEPLADGSVIYMVMPYHPEGSLVDWLLQRSSDLLAAPQDVGQMIMQAASALQHAHDCNIIHQDVKPSNFLVCANADSPTRPDLLLVDFGIARVMSAIATDSKSVRGTHAYMAPEQWNGEAVAATDQYALAIMTYQLLTGQLPFQERSEQIMFQHLAEPPKLPSQLNACLSPAVDAVILHALAEQADERFPTVKAFAVALQQALDKLNQPPSPTTEQGASQPKKEPTSNLAKTGNKSPKRRASLVIAIVLLLIVGGALTTRFVNNQIIINNNAHATATIVAENPDPYPPAGTLAFVDPLSHPKAWSSDSDTVFGGQCQFVNGVYQISQSLTSKYFVCDESKQYSNFTFEVKMTINQGDCGGLVIRGNSDSSNLYLFRVCQDSYCYFFKYESHSGSDTAALASGNSSAINQGTGQANTIAVVAKGSHFDLYVNGQKIGSVSDSVYSQGYIGLIADAPNNATTVTYQDARLWTL